MELPRLALLIFVLEILVAIGADVSLYDDIDQQGLIAKFSDIRQCKTLPFGKKKTSSLDTHGGCIVLYADDNCNGKRLVMYSTSHSHNDLSKWDFNDMTSSVAPCKESDNEKGKSPKLGLYTAQYQRDLLFEGFDLCTCQNLPSFARTKPKSINTHGHCVRLYPSEGCGGKFIEIGGGNDGQHTNHGDLNLPVNIVSYKGCGGSRECVKLNAAITDFEFDNDVQAVLQNAPRKPVELAAQFTISNNGSGTVQEKISQSRTISEEYTFSKVNAFTHMHKVSAEVSVGTKFKTGVPFLAEGEVSVDLKAGYEFNTETSTTDTRQTTTKNEKQFTVEKTVEIPQCTYYTVNTYINLVDKLEIKYTMLVEVTGHYGDEILKADRLKELLPDGMKLLDTKNDSTVRVKVNGSMFATYGLNSFFDGKSRPIPGCIKKQDSK